ncbi:MAG: hypothetical protein IJ848_00250 [Alphaproteobacteria bacterium]|nr:hypothetical protein [Alphaproteobacteria bacterium]
MTNSNIKNLLSCILAVLVSVSIISYNTSNASTMYKRNHNKITKGSNDNRINQTTTIAKNSNSYMFTDSIYNEINNHLAIPLTNNNKNNQITKYRETIYNYNYAKNTCECVSVNWRKETTLAIDFADYYIYKIKKNNSSFHEVRGTYSLKSQINECMKQHFEIESIIDCNDNIIFNFSRLYNDDYRLILGSTRYNNPNVIFCSSKGGNKFGAIDCRNVDLQFQMTDATPDIYVNSVHNYNEFEAPMDIKYNTTLWIEHGLIGLKNDKHSDSVRCCMYPGKNCRYRLPSGYEEDRFVYNYKLLYN